LVQDDIWVFEGKYVNLSVGQADSDIIKQFSPILAYVTPILLSYSETRESIRKRGMEMLEMFEKLINEHGSSTILRERLELFSDKYSMLEEKLNASQQQKEALEAENNRLSAQLERAEREIERLQHQLDSEAAASAGAKLDEAKEQILKTLFETNCEATVAQIGHTIGVPENVAQYHIDALKEKELITFGSLIMNQPITYRLSKEGRKYVVEKIDV